MTCERAAMVRKRRKKEDEQPPWCYYCDRVFSDEQTLVQHQKAKHFKVHIWQPLACQKHIHVILRAVLYTIWQHMQGPRMQALMEGDAVQCTTCHKRLTSAGGLRVHCHQVHRFALEKCVPSFFNQYPTCPIFLALAVAMYSHSSCVPHIIDCLKLSLQ